MMEIRRDEQGREISWDGGYIRHDDAGRPTYYIRRQVRGVRYDTSTRCHTLRAALDHLRRFEEDPAAYVAWSGSSARSVESQGPDPIYLDKAIRDEFLTWSAAAKAEGGKANTAEWCAYQRRELEWWALRLADEQGRALDLRKVTREQVFMVLDGNPKVNAPRATGIRKKQAILKAFYGWLRKYRRGVRITVSEDPLADTPNLPGGVAQEKASKYVPTDDLHKVIEHLVDKGSVYGHALCVHAGTGWHTRELMRFVASGRVDAVPSYVREPGATAVLATPKHKNGKEHLTKVGATVEQSARILLGQKPDEDTAALDGRALRYRGTGEVRGSISESNYKKAVKAACIAVGVPKFSPAWMRHTVATHAVQVGIKSSKVGEFLGHAEGSRMVDIHYATKAIPPKAPTPMDDTGSPAAPGLVPDAPTEETKTIAALTEQIAALAGELQQLKRQTAAPRTEGKRRRSSRGRLVT